MYAQDCALSEMCSKQLYTQNVYTKLKRIHVYTQFKLHVQNFIRMRKVQRHAQINSLMNFSSE